MAAPRLTHRYENRAILHLSSLCAMYCRFCFRKSHLNDDSRTLYEGRLDSTFEYLKSHSEIRELILTGGDPLSLPDPWLKKFLKDLNALPNLKHIRIHSRMSATLPSRLTENLARYLSDQNFSVALVSHFNHPIELTDYAMSRLKHFKQNGISLYNQSVLLKGINDSEQTLFELFQNLYENGIIPFYLHHPDWTIGTFHFHISIEKGKDLMRALQGKLSGPAMPHYVLDIPGGDGKVPLLDETRVKKIKTISDVDSNLGGALYEIQPPYTLESSASSLYADFWRQFPNPR